jgi:hypothetical protein
MRDPSASLNCNEVVGFPSSTPAHSPSADVCAGTAAAPPLVEASDPRVRPVPVKAACLHSARKNTQVAEFGKERYIHCYTIATSIAMQVLEVRPHHAASEPLTVVPRHWKAIEPLQ